MEYITTKEAAKLLKITLRTIQKHCQALGFVKFGGNYMLTACQVEEIRNHMAANPRGRRRHIITRESH